MTDKELMALAVKARENAYSKYSSFSVGAALLTKSGKVFVGCNVENASFSPTCCAERTAIFSAIAAGEREFSAIAVCGGKVGEERIKCMPCGVCRQVLCEFCDNGMRVILEDGDKLSVLTLGELLPYSFNL